VGIDRSETLHCIEFKQTVSLVVDT